MLNSSAFLWCLGLTLTAEKPQNLNQGLSVTEWVLRKEKERTDFPKVSSREVTKGAWNRSWGQICLYLFLALKYGGCSGF